MKLTISMRYRAWRQHFGCGRFVAGVMALGEWIRFGEPELKQPAPSIKETT